MTCVPYNPSICSQRSLVTVPSRLQLFLQLIQEAPLSALRDDLVRRRFDDARLLKAQSVEPNGVFRVILTPARVSNFPHRLRCVFIARRIPAVHLQASNTLWL